MKNTWTTLIDPVSIAKVGQITVMFGAAGQLHSSFGLEISCCAKYLPAKLRKVSTNRNSSNGAGGSIVAQRLSLDGLIQYGDELPFGTALYRPPRNYVLT